jgi:hypothetical protein
MSFFAKTRSSTKSHEKVVILEWCPESAARPRTPSSSLLSKKQNFHISTFYSRANKNFYKIFYCNALTFIKVITFIKVMFTFFARSAKKVSLGKNKKKFFFNFFIPPAEFSPPGAQKCADPKTFFWCRPGNFF